MKLTDEQRQAAAMYWTQLMIGEIKSQSLQSKVVPFMAHMEIIHRKKYIQELTAKHENWPMVFMNHLFQLLLNADVSTTLTLNLHPQGILKQALQMSEIANCVFPMAYLEMHFDVLGNLIVGEQRYTAQQILHQEEFLLSEMFRVIRL